jgi:hypothetical protein
MKPIDNLRARMGHDIGDVCDRIWANTFGDALGSPEGPEPDKRSPRFACHRFRNSVSSQEKEAGAQ